MNSLKKILSFTFCGSLVIVLCLGMKMSLKSFWHQCNTRFCYSPLLWSFNVMFLKRLKQSLFLMKKSWIVGACIYTVHSTVNQRGFFYVIENPAKEHCLHKLKPKIIHVLTGHCLKQVVLLMFEPPVAPENCLHKFSFLHGEQKAPVMENCGIHNASIFKSVKLSKLLAQHYMPTLHSGPTMNYVEVQ